MAAPNSTVTVNSIDTPEVAIIPILLSTLANGGTRKLLVPYSFVLSAIQFRVGNPATTAAKAATLQAQIGGTACTGGAIALTSANCTPAGAAVAGTAITALNSTFTPNSTVEVAVSGVTAFVEGDGYVECTILPTSSG